MNTESRQDFSTGHSVPFSNEKRTFFLPKKRTFFSPLVERRTSLINPKKYLSLKKGTFFFPIRWNVKRPEKGTFFL